MKLYKYKKDPNDSSKWIFDKELINKTLVVSKEPYVPHPDDVRILLTAENDIKLKDGYKKGDPLVEFFPLLDAPSEHK